MVVFFTVIIVELKSDLRILSKCIGMIYTSVKESLRLEYSDLKAKTWNCVECGDLLTASNTLTSDQYNTNYSSIHHQNQQQQQQRSLSWDRKTANLRRSETRFTRFTKPRVMSMKGSYTDQIVCICLNKSY